MPESPLIQIETKSLEELQALIVDRAKRESDIELGFGRRREREKKEYQQAAQQLSSKFKVDDESLRAEYARKKQEAEAVFKRDTQATEAAYAGAKQQADEAFRKEQRRAKKVADEARMQALMFFEGTRDDGIKWRRATEANWSAAMQDLEINRETAEVLFKGLGKMAVASPEEEAAAMAAYEARPVPPPPEAPAPPDPDATVGDSLLDPAAAAPVVEDNPLTRLRDDLNRIEEEIIALSELKLPKLAKASTLIFPALVLGGGVAAGLALGAGMGWTVGGVAGGVLAVLILVGGAIGLGKMARPRVLEHAVPLKKFLEAASREVEDNKEWVKQEFEAKLKAFEDRRASKVSEAEAVQAKAVEEAEGRRREAHKAADVKFPPLVEQIAKRREEQLKKIEEVYPPRIVGLKEKYEKDRKELDDSYRATHEATEGEYARTWQALIDDWTGGMGRIDQALGGVISEAGRRFLDWTNPEVDGWKPPTEVPPGLQFGKFAVDLNQYENGVPRDPRLKSVTTHYDLPALIPFPILSSVLIRASDGGKEASIPLLQSLMLRFLTSVPPGKVRFTIIDPVGLGENFAAFMHLGDYHELLVTSRIWTEPSHIEQRLTDLTEHMENVIQKYLRNEFETIEEYNTMAGEVAEPFRIVVVANFPTSFNDNAIKRLVSIVNSGARCGVYALILHDTKMQLPSGFQLKEIENNCVNIIWKDNKLNWREPNLGRYPLALDAPPDQGLFSKILHRVGAAARDANRVEVPFEFIAPKPDQFWTFSSAKTVDIPLGRSGATKLQHMILGKGTSQHALTSGKTGSGKSTLLHALITNGALRYDPNELEFYLIDFKKGVEFKVYAAMQLPHARVIAVESEREFGLSVLQRLDVELRERGEIYRQVGCQDLNGYREARPEGPPMPRILLVIDEFQEFFVEDDKIAQEVSLLLDRLVRQGRAFGMHVFLGSQTLGGSYSLPRATLGQMAVRIALQCSEADAHLILSEDNTAARLLTRPGEAIYNDANGMVEGNNLFQVVWLPDERREKYLERIQEMCREKGIQKPPPIVFEGNLPAEVSKNPLLNTLLEATAWGEAPKSDQAWLGDAIAIKDPTAVVFRPQSGSNALIVGQNDEAALAMLMMATIGVAAQHPPVGPGSCKFYLLDGSPVDSTLHGRLGKLAEVLPHPVKNVTWRELAATYAELTAEINRRQTDSSGDHPAIYVMIYDIQRFRDLRKSEDDFGFSSRSYDDEPAADPPSKMFVTVLRDGPPVGIHTLVWCDSSNNLNRTFDRTGLREFENRILFQMSSNDSSNLIESPAASKLGENRALYYSEEENRIEKFRPYGVPEPEWLEQVKARFAARPVPEVAASATPAAEPVAVAEPSYGGDGNGAAHSDGNGSAHGNGDSGVGEPDHLIESHADLPYPTGDEPGGPPME